ncbi:MAG: hypothetical protein ABSC64_02330 [Candidatus Korobacteraceae bacterium]
MQLRIAKNYINDAIEKDIGYVRSAFAKTNNIEHVTRELNIHFRTVSPAIWKNAIHDVWSTVGQNSIQLYSAYLVGKGSVSYIKELDGEEVEVVDFEDDEWAPIPEFNFFEKEPEMIIKTWLGDVEYKATADASDQWESAVDSYLAGADNRLSGVSDTTWASIQSDIQAGTANGDDIKTIAASVESNLTDSWANRGETIARTETCAACNYSSLLTAQTSAPNMNKIWMCSFMNSREAHMDADSDYGTGSGIPLDEPFEVGDDELDYPGDPDGSADNIINCMCSIGYENPESSGQAEGTEEGEEGAGGVTNLSGLTDDQNSQLSDLISQLSQGTGALSDEQISFLTSQIQSILSGGEAVTTTGAETGVEATGVATSWMADPSVTELGPDADLEEQISAYAAAHPGMVYDAQTDSFAYETYTTEQAQGLLLENAKAQALGDLDNAKNFKDISEWNDTYNVARLSNTIGYKNYDPEVLKDVMGTLFNYEMSPEVADDFLPSITYDATRQAVMAGGMGQAGGNITLIGKYDSAADFAGFWSRAGGSRGIGAVGNAVGTFEANDVESATTLHEIGHIWESAQSAAVRDSWGEMFGDLSSGEQRSISMYATTDYLGTPYYSAYGQYAEGFAESYSYWASGNGDYLPQAVQDWMEANNAPEDVTDFNWNPKRLMQINATIASR